MRGQASAADAVLGYLEGVENVLYVGAVFREVDGEHIEADFPPAKMRMVLQIGLGQHAKTTLLPSHDGFEGPAVRDSGPGFYLAKSENAVCLGHEVNLTER